MITIPKITVISDESHRAVQPQELAKAILKKFGMEYGPDYKFSDGHVKEIDYIKTVQIDDTKKIVISCGLDTVPEIVRMKLTDPTIYAISIQDPGKHHDKFDLIVASKHDHPPEGNNVVVIDGMINHINPDYLTKCLEDEHLKELREQLEQYPSPRIAVLVGGKHVGGDVDVMDAQVLAEQASKIANGLGGSLLVSTSRRTEVEPTAQLRAGFMAETYFYDYNYDGQDINPYDLILALADAIIVTADSVRMCSEAASSGKPTWIANPRELFFAYKDFHDVMVNDGYAKPLTPLTPANEIITKTSLLDEVTKVAEMVLERNQ